MGDPLPIRSYAESNRTLAEAFDRYQVARGQSANTLRAYHESVAEFITSLGSESVVEADRTAIRKYQAWLLERGVHENTLRLRTMALRQFFKFLSVAGLTRGHNPTLLLAHRKLPGRLPRVLTVAEVEKLIGAAETPVEAAVVEVLYGTGVRVSELCSLRLADVDFTARAGPYRVMVRRGKGNRDRLALLGEPAMRALRCYLGNRESEFLFEVLPGLGSVHKNSGRWIGSFADRDRRRGKVLSLGKISDLPDAEAAMRVFKRLLEKEPGFRPGRSRPYAPRGIRWIISRLAARAGIGHVHPHALRRAAATHLLADGAGIREVQEFLGHLRISTTQIYTHLSVANLKETYDRCHPHAKEIENVEEK